MEFNCQYDRKSFRVKRMSNLIDICRIKFESLILIFDLRIFDPQQPLQEKVLIKNMASLKPGEMNLGVKIKIIVDDNHGSHFCRRCSCRGRFQDNNRIIYWYFFLVISANRVTDKLTQVHDKIFCCRSGSAADTQAIADIVHYYLQLFGF